MNKNSQSDQPDLFDDLSDDARRGRTRSSMLWAAYADALGFISELVDERGLKRRTKGAPLDQLLPWKRRVGGRGGVDIQLPAGCWSDDTQLRMAVSRAINRYGFDVESFARIELPVWPSYALGGGRASKAAAASLGKPDALWYANTFQGWVAAGGNGAAMRIQPHVWSAADLDGGYTLDVIIDSVCTHGHPRAIAGACFHAATLAHCVGHGVVPDADATADLAAAVGGAIELLADHSSLGSTWRGLWEEATGRNLRDEWDAAVHELSGAVEAVTDAIRKDSVSDSYAVVSDRLGLTIEEQRGSGILTPVAAWALAMIAPNPREAVAAAVNALGTDTDTIATMAGALLGACHVDEAPPEEPLDSTYLVSEADRLVQLSRDSTNGHHSYPDLLTWTAPPTQADALVTSGDRLLVEGLGPVTEMDRDIVWTPRGDFAWQWVRTDFGQTLLIKRRPELKLLGSGNTLVPPPPPPNSGSGRRGRSQTDPDAPDIGTAPLDRGVNVDAAVEFARAHIEDNGALGYTLRRVARDGTLADLVALVTALREEMRR